MQTDITMKIDEKNEISTLYVGGYLDAHTASKFESKIQEIIKSEKYNIILNFTELEYISSAGLGVIMGNIEDIRNHDGDIKLTGMSDKIYRVFDLVGFPSLYEIYRTQEEAESSFGSGS